jgi:hypothetical protein
VTKNDASPTALAEARKAGETVASIMKRTGLSYRAVRWRAEKGGFVVKRRSQVDPILKRLRKALKRQIEIVETRIASAEGMSRIDSEREARTMSGLTRLYERLTEMAGRVTAKKAVGSARQVNSAGEGDGETERMRRDLAERLDRLRRQSGGG